MTQGERAMILGLSSALAGLAVSVGAGRLAPAWDELARRRVAAFRPRMQALGMDESGIARFLRLWGASMLASVVVLWLLCGMPVLALGVAALLFVSPGYLLEARIARRRALMRDQMTTACVTLANAVRAGMSLAQGLHEVGAETPPPMGLEFRRIVGEYERGRPLAEAIHATKQRLGLDSFALFSSALLACLERGGRITEALVSISRSLQENQRLERKLEADTASGRKLMLILGAFPFAFMGLLYLMDPNTGTIFRSAGGQLVLLAVGLLVFVSFKVSKKILSIEI